MSLRRYRVESLLRRGGMGILYKAWDTKLDRPVALKIVSHPLDPDACRRALREAKAATRVRSDHVVQVFDAGEADQLGCPYLVMELLTGEDLQAVSARGPVSADAAVDWILQACEALAHLELHGLVHRDVKPANLFLESRIDGSRRLKLLDFGVVKDLAGDTQRSHPTDVGEVIGSLPYMAPEQVLDSCNVDVRADVWGLGTVLYELLAGQAAFVSKTRLQAMAQIMDQPHTPLHRLPLRIPDGLSDVVDRCLEKRREARWSSIAELAIALAPFASVTGALLVPRVCAIQAAQRPLPEEPPELGTRATMASAPTFGGSEEQDQDTGVDFGSLRVRAEFVATVPSGGKQRQPFSSRTKRSWPRRSFGAVGRSGVVGPLLVAAAVTIVAMWPSLRSLGRERYGRLASTASHCMGTFSTYPAVSMSHQVGNPRGDYWNLYTNGWVSQQHRFSAGDAEVRIAAAADLAGDDPPRMIVSVDDQVIGEVDVPSEDFTTFAFPYSASAGPHSVRVQFSNDYLQGGKDRNLILGDVAVGQCQGPDS